MQVKVDRARPETMMGRAKGSWDIWQEVSEEHPPKWGCDDRTTTPDVPNAVYAQRVARLLVVGSVVFLFRDRYGYRNRTTPCQTTKIRSNATHHSFRMRPFDMVDQSEAFRVIYMDDERFEQTKVLFL